MLTIGDFNSFWGFLGHPVVSASQILFTFLSRDNRTCFLDLKWPINHALALCVSYVSFLLVCVISGNCCLVNHVCC